MEAVMRQKRKLAEHVWYEVSTAVMLLSSAAGSMPPHRGAVFKQRPQCFGRFYGRAVIHFSSVAQFLSNALIPQCGLIEQALRACSISLYKNLFKNSDFSLFSCFVPVFSRLIKANGLTTPYIGYCMEENCYA
jgi:hypothetical protein